MSEKPLSDRIDVCERIQESQQTALHELSGKLRELESKLDGLQDLAKRTRELEEDLALLVRHTIRAQNDIIAWAALTGHVGYDQAEVKRCQKFTDKYQIRNE